MNDRARRLTAEIDALTLRIATNTQLIHDLIAQRKQQVRERVYAKRELAKTHD